MSTNNTDNTDNEELSNNMYDIVNTENERLQEKKLNIDQQMESKERLRLLNDNIRKRGEDISKIVIAFVFVLIIFTLLRLAVKRFPNIPDYLFEIPNFILVAVGIIYIFTIVTKIIGRDRLYYDKLIFENPPLDDPEKIKQNHDNAARDDLTNLCQGEVCCDPYNDLFYDPDTNKCTYRPNSAEATAAELDKQSLLTKQIAEAEEKARIESEKRLALEKQMQENKERREKEMAEQKARSEQAALQDEQERKKREEEELLRKKREEERKRQRRGLISDYLKAQFQNYINKLNNMENPDDTKQEASSIEGSNRYKITVTDLTNSSNPQDKVSGKTLTSNISVINEGFMSKIFLNNENDTSIREGFNDKKLDEMSKKELEQYVLVHKSTLLKNRHNNLVKEKEEKDKRDKAAAAEKLRKQKEEEKRRQEEIARKQREEAERIKREAAEKKRKLEEERKKREEAERKKREEAERKKREEEERKKREEEERKRQAELNKDKAIKDNHKNPNFVFNRVRIAHTRKDYLHFSELQVWSKNRNIALYKNGGRASFIKGGTYKDANKAIDNTANKGTWYEPSNSNIAHSRTRDYPIWELRLPQNVHSMRDLQAIIIFNRMDSQNYGYTERSKGWQISLWKDDKEVYRLPVVDTTNFAYKIKGGRRPHRQKNAWFSYWLGHILHDGTRNQMLIPNNRFNNRIRRKGNKVAILAHKKRNLPTGVKVWDLRRLAKQKSWLENFVNFGIDDAIESFVSFGFDVQDTIESFTSENFTNLFNYE